MILLVLVISYVADFPFVFNESIWLGMSGAIHLLPHAFILFDVSRVFYMTQKGILHRRHTNTNYATFRYFKSTLYVKSTLKRMLIENAKSQTRTSESHYNCFTSKQLKHTNHILYDYKFIEYTQMLQTTL